jgi:hypothetical protein
MSALAVQQPAVRPLAALLWHQAEEWVWPGGFLPWMNREVIGSDDDELPLDRRIGFVINVVSRRALGAGVVGGVAMSIGLISTLKRRRLRGSRR